MSKSDAAAARPFVRIKARLIDTAVCATVIAFLGGIIALTVAVAVARGTPQILPFHYSLPIYSDLTTVDPTPSFVYQFGSSMEVVGSLLWGVSLIVLCYEMPMVALRGQTLGKKIMGIKVIQIENGLSPGWIRSLARCTMLLIFLSLTTSVMVNTGILINFYEWMLLNILSVIPRISDYQFENKDFFYIAPVVAAFITVCFLFYWLFRFCGLSWLGLRRGLHDRAARTMLINA